MFEEYCCNNCGGNLFKISSGGSFILCCGCKTIKDIKLLEMEYQIEQDNLDEQERIFEKENKLNKEI